MHIYTGADLIFEKRFAGFVRHLKPPRKQLIMINARRTTFVNPCGSGKSLVSATVSANCIYLLVLRARYKSNKI